MKAFLCVLAAIVPFASQAGEACSGAIIPDQSITFWAAFENRKEAQEYLGAFFRAKSYRLNATSDGLHFLYVGLPSGQHAVAHGTIRPGSYVCVMVDLYSEELRSAVTNRSPASRARMAAEAAELVIWLRDAGAKSIRQYDARPWDERSECLSASSNTSLEQPREK